MNPENKIIKIIPVIIICAIFIILFIQMLSRAGNNDFTSYMLSSKALLENTNPYNTGSPFPYVYPLTLAFILIPFTLLPDIPLQILWFILNVFFLYKIFEWTICHAEFKIDKGKYFFVLIFLIFYLNIIQNNLLNGQINIFLLFLCCLFYVNYKKSNTFLTSLFLSIAISVKLVPVFLLVYLLIRKEYKLIMYVVFLTFIFILLPVVIIGENIFTYYNFYFQKFLSANLSPALNEEYQSGMFYSLTGLIKFINPVLTTGLLPTIICLAVVMLFFILTDKYYIKNNKTLIFFLYLCGFLLISPVSETHHLIFLGPLIILILADYWINYRQKNYLDYIVLLIVIILLFAGKNYHYLYFPMIVISIVLFIKNILTVDSRPPDPLLSEVNRGADLQGNDKL